MDTIVRWLRGKLLGGGAEAKNLSVLSLGRLEPWTTSGNFEEPNSLV
jgi:hypothetical protein